MPEPLAIPVSDTVFPSTSNDIEWFFSTESVVKIPLATSLIALSDN